jgi:hypothetical protein
MSTNTIKVLTAISKEISRRFDVKADLINCTNRQYDKPHTAWGANSGSSIQVKKPQKLSASESVTIDIQDVEEQTATVAVTNDVHVALGFTASELTQDLLNPSNMKMFGDDYLESAIDNIIGKAQTNYFTYMKNKIYNSVGTAGTGPTTYQIITQARAKLNNGRAPRGDRYFILDPDNAALLNNAQSGLFHAGDRVAQNYKDGSVAPSNGFVFIESPDMGSHVNGAGASYAVDGASQTGSSILLKTGTGAIPKGTIITFGSGSTAPHSVDPVTGAAKSSLQQFVVTADYAGGAGSISISPSIVTSGALKTVDQSPADSAAVTIVGSASTSYTQGIALHRDAFIFATAELADIGVTYEVPIVTGGAGEGYSQGSGPAKGLYMKLYMDGDITNRRSVARLDMRYGYGDLLPEWATRIQGV